MCWLITAVLRTTMTSNRLHHYANFFNLNSVKKTVVVFCKVQGQKSLYGFWLENSPEALCAMWNYIFIIHAITEKVLSITFFGILNQLWNETLSIFMQTSCKILFICREICWRCEMKLSVDCLSCSIHDAICIHTSTLCFFFRKKNIYFLKASEYKIHIMNHQAKQVECGEEEEVANTQVANEALI